MIDNFHGLALCLGAENIVLVFVHGLALCLGAENIVLVFVVPVISKTILVFCFVLFFAIYFIFKSGTGSFSYK